MRAVSVAHLRTRRRLVMAVAGCVALGGRHAVALDPRSAVTLIVPAAAGVSSDRLRRIVADALSTILECRCASRTSRATAA